MTLKKTIPLRVDPIHLLELFQDEPYVFCLDSSLHQADRGRYTFIGFDPFDVFEGKGKDCLQQLRQRFVPFASRPFEHGGAVPFQSGIVGGLAYDYGLWQESIRLKAKEDLFLPDCVFGFYDCVLTMDHLAKTLTIASSGLPERNDHLRKARAQARLHTIVKKVVSFLDSKKPEHSIHVSADIEASSFIRDQLKSHFSKETYIQAVRKALDYIAAGDIYQVNLSQRFCYDLQNGADNPWEIYRVLRRMSPSSFGGYFNAGSFQLISSSPERFIRLNDRIVTTRPMKGTRPRGTDIRKDEALRDELVRSTKDRAELLMITDLMRNDLGRVCEYGSVYVKEPRTIEEYSTVFQATSTIEGRLQKDKDGFDLLQACFPGGSITGCPKIRSMEIIEELEPTRRSFYTGSMGYMDFSGRLDFNILIRTLLKMDGHLYFQTGGGIVADSDPDQEYEETLVKAKGIMAALGQLSCQNSRSL